VSYEERYERVSTPAQPHVVERRVVETDPYAVDQVAVDSHTWSDISMAQVIHAIAGLFLIVIGCIAMARGGFNGNLTEQESQVLGILHSTAIGMVEVGLGLLLLIAALTPAAKAFGGFVGALLIVAGIVVVSASTSTLQDLHTERALGWIALIVGAVSLLAVFLPEHVVTRRHRSAIMR